MVSEPRSYNLVMLCRAALSCPVRLRSPSLSGVLAAVVLVCVTEHFAGPSWTRLAQVLPKMPIGNLPGVSELRGRAYGIGPSQAGCYGSLEGEGLLPPTCLAAGKVLVEREVGL